MERAHLLSSDYHTAKRPHRNKTRCIISRRNKCWKWMWRSRPIRRRRGGPQDHKKSEEGEGTQRDIFRWSNSKANFAWVTHFSKWVPLLPVHQLVDPPTEVKVSQGGGALPRPRRVHRRRQTTNTSRRVLRRVCVCVMQCISFGL